MAAINPRIGCWYRDVQQGQIFEVVALDDQDRTIEAQLVDGEICEYDADSWSELSLESISEPEDWRGPYEAEANDYDDDGGYGMEDWDSPLSNIEPDVINGIVDEF